MVDMIKLQEIHGETLGIATMIKYYANISCVIYAAC